MLSLILFQPAKFCGMFPVVNYILMISGLIQEDVRMLESNHTSIVANDLQENSLYAYKIVAVNTFGSVSSKDRMLCKCSFWSVLPDDFIIITSLLQTQQMCRYSS